MKILFWLVFVLFLTIEISPQQKIGKHTLSEWRYIIDTTWGTGQTTAEKLQTFDAFWNTIDQKYAGFNGIVDNWQQLRSYRDTVALGVSRGRFAGILDYLVKSVQDTHVWMLDQGITSTSLNAGVPLLYPLGVNTPKFNWESTSHFGAALTPLPDSTLLVYAAVPNHPLGLLPGDLILGYDGRLWKNLYKELLEVQFPIPNEFVMYTSERAATHQWLQCAGMNWHLFDTINVVKYETGDTLHFPTSLLSNPMPGIYATEQLPIDGVPFPDVTNGHYARRGYVNGTNIGYIYLMATIVTAGEEFLTAINSFMPDSSSEALIIDMRLNQGGGRSWDIGLRRLFNQNVETMRWLNRVSVSDHLALQDNGEEYLTGSDAELYDRPIAVLCGPATVSGGDQAVNVLRAHPMVRTFGLPTNGAFGTGISIPGLSNQWVSSYTTSVLYTPPNTNINLNHKSVPVDEEVWLTRDGVANGQDDVVNRALEWINNLVYPHDIIFDKTYYSIGQDTIHLSTIIENPNSHQLTAKGYFYNLNDDLIDSANLTKQAMITDGEKWTGEVSTPQMEDYFKVSVNVFDQSTIDNFIAPSATRFTTAGPVVIESYSLVELTGAIGLADFKLKNDGSIKTIENVIAKLKTTDTCVTSFFLNNTSFGDIAPGEIKKVDYAFAFNINDDADTIALELEICSDGIVYWTESFKVDILTDIEDELTNLPKKFALEQNYPNPFNPNTTVKYSIPQLSFVTIKIYDVLGSEVATLVNEEIPVGTYELSWSAANLPSGVYFYRLQAGSFIETKKLILIK